MAAALGVAGSAAHLALAGEHARHEPVLTAGMVLLALVCLRCSVRLWRRPDDPVAWRDTIVLAVLMAGLHLIAGGGSPIFLAIPALQLGLAVPAVVR